MKKQIAFVLVLVLLSVFAIASEPGLDFEAGEVEDIQGKIDKIPIDPDTGNFDPSRLNKSIAEERVEKINGWLNENAEWLKLVFGMVPEISGRFAFVLYFWLAFFVLFVLNRKIFMLFNFMILKNDSQSSQAKTYALIVGIGGFIVLAVLRVIYHIGNFVYLQWYVVWNWLLPLGIIAVAVGIIALAVLAIMFPSVFLAFAKWAEKKREARAKEIESEDRTNLHTIVGRALGEDD